MLVTWSLFASIFVGAVAAGVIPGFAGRDDIVPGGGLGGRGDSPLGFLSKFPIPTGFPFIPPGIPFIPFGNPLGGSDHTQPTGKYPHFVASLPLTLFPPGISSGGFDRPKTTEKHSYSATSRGSNPTSVTASLGFPSSGSDRPEPTEKHSRSATSHGTNSTNVGSHTPGLHSTHLSNPHSRSTSYKASKTPSLPHHSNFPVRGSDRPKHTNKPSHAWSSYKAHVLNPTDILSIHSMLRRATLTKFGPNHFSTPNSDHPEPTTRAALH